MRAMRLAPIARLALPALLLTACGGPARIELDPASLTFSGRGQTGALHATPRARSGKPMPERRCIWTSSDGAIATVSAKGNDATVTATGPGSATITCAIGDVKGESGVSVRVVARITLGQASAALALTDEKQPLALRVDVFDDQGAPVAGRLVLTRCDDEEVCRGDTRGQLWATGAGSTTATVEVEGIKATLPVTVTDRRVDSKPKVLKKGYMEDLEREVRQRQAKEAAEAAKAAGQR
jgi:hypothetical protein